MQREKTGGNRMQGEITHRGIVKEHSSTKIIVSIMSQSACAACHANALCSAADVKDKEIEISHFSGDYHIGQQVEIVGRTSQGIKALFLAYLLPFLLVMVVLIGSGLIIKNQGITGLLSLGVLVPYYLILYLMRNHIQRNFEFEIKPIE